MDKSIIVSIFLEDIKGARVSVGQLHFGVSTRLPRLKSLSLVRWMVLGRYSGVQFF